MCDQQNEQETVSDPESVPELSEQEKDEAAAVAVEDMREYAGHLTHAADDLEAASMLAMQHGDIGGFITLGMQSQELRRDVSGTQEVIDVFEAEGRTGLDRLVAERREEALHEALLEEAENAQPERPVLENLAEGL